MKKKWNMQCIGIEETKLREKKTWETWKCQSCWKCIRFYFSRRRNTGCRVYFSDWTMQKVQNRRVPRWRFSFRNSDEYWLRESSYNIKHSEDLFFGASVAPKGIIYRFILLISPPPPPPLFATLFFLMQANGSLVTESEATFGSLVSAEWRRMQRENSADVCSGCRGSAPDHL